MNINDKLQKILQLKEQLKQEMASPEYQEVKKMERQAYLKNLNDWRNIAHTNQKRTDKLNEAGLKAIEAVWNNPAFQK